MAVSMPRTLIWRHIILPQVGILILPPLTIEFTALVKASALVSVIGVVEVTRAGPAARRLDLHAGRDLGDRRDHLFRDLLCPRSRHAAYRAIDVGPSGIARRVDGDRYIDHHLRVAHSP